MHSLSSLPKSATLLLIAILCIAAPLQSVTAADALTTSSSSSSSSSSSATQLERSILGLPYGILKSVFSGISKVASNVVTKHVKKN